MVPERAATSRVSWRWGGAWSRRARLAVASLVVSLPAACERPLPPEGEAPDGVSGTFSIVAVDPESGVCGAAVASRYPAVGKVVVAARGDAGAFATQHWHHPPWRERALDLLARGEHPLEVLAALLEGDPKRDQRQLAIIDRAGRVAQHHPTGAAGPSLWWGGASGRYWACQGNTLAGRAVIDAMARAYEETDGSLGDRLMAALVAGDRAGGDHRGRLAAGIRLARGGEDGYWLEVDVDRSDDAVEELLRRYLATEHPARGGWDGRTPGDRAPGAGAPGAGAPVDRTPGAESPDPSR